MPFAEAVDLEKTQDFILETKKIDILNHPHAFNPSIVRWHGMLIMSFREICDYNFEPSSDNTSGGGSLIGLVLLDENFCPKAEAQILDLDDYPTSHSNSLKAEDPRLLTVGEDLYIVYSDNKLYINDIGGYRMYAAQLNFDGMFFYVSNTKCLMSFEGESVDRREKNWVPFDFYNELFFAYSLNPHRILYPTEEGFCETFCSSHQETLWKWGELRGGTPALLEGDQYLAFFHSSIDLTTTYSQGQIMPHYFMGAYTFNNTPPFEITAISPEPIIGADFYKGPLYTPYWKPVVVVFPCGFLSNDEFIWVIYGRQDHELWVVKINKAGLLKSLNPLIL